VPRGVRDPELEAGMEDTRALVRLGRAAREEAGIRVRQPLPSVQAVLPGGRRLAPDLEAALRDELNVKQVVFPAGDADIVRLSAKPEFGRLGPRFGADTPAVARAISALGADDLRRLRAGEPVGLELDGNEVVVEPADVRVIEEAKGDLTVEAGDGYLLGLDTALSEDLIAEGLARELVSRVQRLRRDAGLDVSDRIRLAIAGPERIEAAVRTHADWIGGETLAVELATGGEAVGRLEHQAELDVEGDRVVAALTPTMTAR